MRSEDPSAIPGARLTQWSVAPDGQRVRVGFEDETGRAWTISLPIDLLSGLMMTIPRMLREALAARSGDNSLRMIHPLGDWRVERALGADAAILSLATPDGFEVAFAVPPNEADRLGEMLRVSAEPEAASRAAIH